LADNKNSEEKIRDWLKNKTDSHMKDIEQMFLKIHGGDEEKVNLIESLLMIFQMAKELEQMSKGYNDFNLFEELIAANNRTRS